MSSRDLQEGTDKLETNSSNEPLNFRNNNDTLGSSSSSQRITESEIDVNDVINSMADNEGHSGATLIFVGSVRNFGINGKVQRMYYESYSKMAENKIKHIERMAMDKYGIKKIRIVHRIGELALGNNSVIIALSTPHSNDAFRACKYILAKIKQEVPIWKKEILSKGNEKWVDGKSIKTN
ncbi:molybdenum cofactor biosynthesis protein MoaE [Candidatus Nitrosocosmicus arcticus]|uniref:Large subunit of molybdopterin synthase n=1 Tax=Candidatus Nitrosocosmicus arcticus TaxID=2035267 RepID=A0A557STL1_9ARCH|nr:molybdenum cofactor biosynthesis protein MoaE [Candidatus Nitrosocosmicus arcticus]TVP39940.1 large subunit of molybdopterin synthase [Candidatus Nitrosocosmicus arcticus]